MSGSVIVPYYKFLDSDFLDVLDRMELPPDWSIMRKPGFNAADQRQWLAEHFEGEWLFSVDSDQDLPPTALLRLLESGLPIVAGVYYAKTRDEGFGPLVLKNVGRDEEHVWKYRPYTNEILTYLRDHKSELTGNPAQVLQNPYLFECDAVGMGCVLIHRRVFEKLDIPYFSFAERGKEDLYFCRKAKAAGFGIWADLSVQCGHFSRQSVGWPHLAAHEGVIK